MSNPLANRQGAAPESESATERFHKPERWDVPFGEHMTKADVDLLLAIPPFSSMDPARFPPAASLRDILLNDSRIRRYARGDIVVREGDYGNSAFFILSGAVAVVSLPGRMLGRREPQKKTLARSLARLWRNPPLPEVRHLDLSGHAPGSPDPAIGVREGHGDETAIFLQDAPVVLKGQRAARLAAGEWFGEIAALGRTPRTATIVADEQTQLLEIRWQGLRDIRARDPQLKAHIDQLFRERGLRTHLRETPLFRGLTDDALNKLADQTRFETYGQFDWFGSFRTIVALSPAERLKHEPLIVREGDYPNGLLLIRAGFARLSKHFNHGERTISYLGRGQAFGLGELLRSRRTGRPEPLRRSLRAVGYVDVLVVPTAAIEELVLPTLSPETLQELVFGGPDTKPVEFLEELHGRVKPELVEFLMDNRFFNGTAAMMVDLDRCTRCDDCVRACAATHDGNPRFLRHGPQYDGFMIANACMHCVDPVCMIGCPTGAIHRSSVGGQVVINDDTCIGCATCAEACPYHNIQLVEIRQPNGAFYLDPKTHLPIQKAAKCDLCVDQLGGPACARACPHDALVRIDLNNLSALSQWLNR